MANSSTTLNYKTFNPSGTIDMQGSTTVVTEYHNSPAPVSGEFIEFPDGSRFRKATGYARVGLFRSLGASENTVFRSTVTGAIKTCRTGPGGYDAGGYTSPIWNHVLDSDLGIDGIMGAPTFPTMEYNEAVTKALSKLADQKANMGENIATLGQTISLIRNPAKALYNSITRMRNDRAMKPYLSRSYNELSRIRDLPKDIASTYLKWVYGVKPLMQDIYSLVDYAQQTGKKPLLFNARGRSSRELSSSDRAFNDVSERRRGEWSSITGNSRMSVSIWAKISDKYPGTRTLNQLGLLNPASLIWELVPYSFVVDWFVPIGPVLNAFTAPAGLDFVDGSVSRRVSANWQVQDYRYSSSKERNISVSPGSSKFQYEGYKRTHMGSFPRPGLWFDNDPLRLRHNGADRDLKALALAIMKLK